MSPLDSRVIDANSEALGVTVKTLMGNAGKAVADYLDEHYPGKDILFVCGPGNNGGDGFAAASMMDPSRVSVAMLKKPSDIHTQAALGFYSELKCHILDYSEISLKDYDVVVDCALGTGASGKVREPYRTFILDSHTSDPIIVSVDIPSGFGSDETVIPKTTITFHDLKNGMNSKNSGEIIVTDIGIPADAVDIVGPGDMLRYPVPGKNSHKGENGRVMIIAGGPYFGAPSLSSLSAFRTGADIVRLFCPESIHNIIASRIPELMITDIPGDHLTIKSVDMLLKESKNYDAVLIGPGLGTSIETQEAVRSFVSECNTPMVIDADGITAVVGIEFHSDVVLTPHHGEFKRLGGCCQARELAERINATILLKGSIDEISDGMKTRLNRTGTPAMTGAGTGDVLAGCVTALLSKGMTTFDSACLGAFICGRAGELAASDKSYGMMASDIIDEIPHVLRDLL